ncbi:DUF1971 domain-containing protein [Tabrizicola sp.]|uniref:DUF1971 domain-containing protein n=1 Tax=Tabrizicola sp. TaxID=2005166 RepID=UPI003F3120F4
MSLAARKLPPGLVQHKQSPEFSLTSIPAALGRDHSTKAGVWGVLNVTSGSVVFHDKELGETREINTGEVQVIPPQTIHSVTLTDDSRFFIQFFRDSDSLLSGMASRM